MNDQEDKGYNDEDEDLYASRSSRKPFMPGAYGDEEEIEVPVHTVEYMHDVPLKMVVEIGRTDMSIRDILALKKGAVCEFTKVVGEPMDIIVGGRLMARGEIVVVNERYGVRISEVTRPEEGGGGGQASS